MPDAVDLAPTRSLPSWLPRLARFIALAGSFFAALYYPYPADSLPTSWLEQYIHGVAACSRWLIAWFEPHVRLVDGLVIAGRFPLQIVLDCTALDVQALYAAAVLASPARWKDKAAGLVLGLVALSLANLMRIVVLYLAGSYAPAHFDLLHEDVMTFALMVFTCLAYYAFSRASAPR